MHIQPAERYSRQRELLDNGVSHQAMTAADIKAELIRIKSSFIGALTAWCDGDRALEGAIRVFLCRDTETVPRSILRRMGLAQLFIPVNEVRVARMSCLSRDTGFLDVSSQNLAAAGDEPAAALLSGTPQLLDRAAHLFGDAP